MEGLMAAGESLNCSLEMRSTLPLPQGDVEQN